MNQEIKRNFFFWVLALKTVSLNSVAVQTHTALLVACIRCYYLNIYFTVNCKEGQKSWGLRRWLSCWYFGLEIGFILCFQLLLFYQCQCSQWEHFITCRKTNLLTTGMVPDRCREGGDGEETALCVQKSAKPELLPGGHAKWVVYGIFCSLSRARCEFFGSRNWFW